MLGRLREAVLAVLVEVAARRAVAGLLGEEEQGLLAGRGTVCPRLAEWRRRPQVGHILHL